MSISSRLFRRIAFGSVAVVLTSLGADAPTRTIDAGGLKFEVPSSWKSTTPSSSMRRAQLSVAPVKGDEDPAELVVFAFPGGAGGVEENVKRWQSGFKDQPKAETKVVKGKNVDVTRVEIAGHYVAAVVPGRPEANNKPNYRLLGGIVLTGGTGYFLKLVGPDKTVQAAAPGFDALLASMNAESK